MFTIYLQGFKSQALAVTFDPEHKFELALQLGDLKTAYQIAKETEVRVLSSKFSKNVKKERMKTM